MSSPPSADCTSIDTASPLASCSVTSLLPISSSGPYTYRGALVGTAVAPSAGYDERTTLSELLQDWACADGASVAAPRKSAASISEWIEVLFDNRDSRGGQGFSRKLLHPLRPSPMRMSSRRRGCWQPGPGALHPTTAAGCSDRGFSRQIVP